mgnify:CR=1 FL=1
MKVKTSQVAQEARHPAKFSDVILDEIEMMLKKREFEGRILDPFAGTGKIHRLSSLEGVETVGLEIEPEWAEMHPGTVVGDALCPPFEPRSFEAIVTSPVYGSRMSDHHNARDNSARNTYKHCLGRDLHPNNSGQLHFGEQYKEFHLKAWGALLPLIDVGGIFILNVSNFIKKGEEVDVVGWHRAAVSGLVGSLPLEVRTVVTPRYRRGSNSSLRVPSEVVLLWDLS